MAKWGIALVFVLLQALHLTGAQQKQDEEYNKLIKQYLQDPRISTDLVDHMPARPR
jgi:hypothetical protein